MNRVYNSVKNPRWLEASQFVIYKCGLGFELRATKKQIQVVVRAGLEPRTAGYRVQHADHLAMLIFLVSIRYVSCPLAI